MGQSFASLVSIGDGIARVYGLTIKTSKAVEGQLTERKAG